MLDTSDFDRDDYRERRKQGKRGQRGPRFKKGDGIVMGEADIEHMPKGSGLRKINRPGKVHGRGRVRRRGSL